MSVSFTVITASHMPFRSTLYSCICSKYTFLRKYAFLLAYCSTEALNDSCHLWLMFWRLGFGRCALRDY